MFHVLRGFAPLPIAVLLACAASPASTSIAPAPSADAPPAPDAPEAAEPSGPPSLVGVAPGVDGCVVDVFGVPVAGRSFVLVDGRGRRTAAQTDDGGLFRVSDVRTPYDLAFAPPSDGAIVEPVAYLGLGRRDPRLALPERQGPGAPSHLVHVTVTLPACVDSACWVSVTTASPSGAGADGRAYGAGEARASFAIEHAWNVDDLAVGESIDVHAVTVDGAYAAFAYAAAVGTDGTLGDASDVGLVPAPIGAVCPVTAHASGSVSRGWESFVAPRVVLGSGASIALPAVSGHTFVGCLPSLAGATFDVTAWADEPHAVDRPWDDRSVSAWSALVPLAAQQVDVDYPTELTLTRPKPDGVLARKAVGLAWRSGAGTMSVELYDLAHERRDFRVYTSEASVPFKRLEHLGIARPEIGAHVLETTRSGGDLEALTDPALAGAARAAGASSYERFALTVTP
jgi:hypothetical protein